MRATIEATNRKLEGWYATGAVDSVAAAYATDATMMGPNAKAVVGRDSIRVMWAGVLANALPHFSIKTETVHVADSLAIEHGRYTLQIRGKTPADSNKVFSDDRGNYVVAWILRDGHWFLLYDIATSELPLVSAPAKK